MANRSKFYFLKAGFSILIFACAISPAWGLDCPACGAKDLPSLILICPNCSKSLHSVESVVKARSTASLIIEMIYTGERPEKLPDYGKLFINKKYKGNVPIIDRERREKVVIGSDRKGLGHDYTALYRVEKRDLDTGLYKVQVEMVFKRYNGFLKSHKRVDFPRVMLKSGEKTVIRHAFSGPGDFKIKGQKNPEKQESDAPFLNYGTGTISLELPIIN